MPRPPDSFAENPVYHIPAGPVHPEKIETDFFAGRLPPSRDREAAADTFCKMCIRDSLISFETGESITYGLFNAQERGTLFIGPGVKVYEGMVVGVSPKQEDITVNVCKKKQQTNTRASGSDDALRLVPPRKMSLEQCLEFLADDELLEVTPENLRIRKTCLLYTSVQRKNCWKN